MEPADDENPYTKRARAFVPVFGPEISPHGPGNRAMFCATQADDTESVNEGPQAGDTGPLPTQGRTAEDTAWRHG